MTVDTNPQHTDPADQPNDLDALRAEVAAETDPDGNLPDGAVLVPLRDTQVAVLNPLDWPASANEDVNNERFYSWAMKALARDEDKQTWEQIDPTNREVVQFLLEDWPKVSGVAVGDSHASRAMRRSSARTRGNSKGI